MSIIRKDTCICILLLDKVTQSSLLNEVHSRKKRLFFLPGFDMIDLESSHDKKKNLKENTCSEKIFDAFPIISSLIEDFPLFFPDTRESYQSRTTLNEVQELSFLGPTDDGMLGCVFMRGLLYFQLTLWV